MQPSNSHPERSMNAMKLPGLHLSRVLCLLSLLLHFYLVTSELRLNYYSKTCPKAEEIIKQQVVEIEKTVGTVAESWMRILFHDCMVQSCDASILLETTQEIQSELESVRSFGIRNLKYLDTIKKAVESECPSTVSCADILALAAKDAIVLRGGPEIQMKTGRRDSKKSSLSEVDQAIPNHNDSTSSVLSHFGSIGLDVEETVAILGVHSIGRTHCHNLVQRLYPTVDPTLDPDYAEYLKERRCPTPTPDPEKVEYARNDRETPYILDNYYYKNLLAHKGLLVVDQQLASDPRTSSYVNKFAADNEYFYQLFARAVQKLSENNPLVGDEGEIRKDCRYVNSN